jgi:hypothetical protein
MLFVPHQVEEIIKHAGLIGLVNYNGITQVVFENCNPAIVIKDGAFQNWPDLQTICIPKGVTTIGNHVFFGCKSLYCVTFAPKSQLESIGSNAFSGCSRLSVVRFSGKQLREIGDYAFEACALWSIEIPESVTNMGNWVFGRCPRLEVAIIHSGLRVGHDVFTNCRSLRCVMIVSEAETINEDYYSQLLGILLDGQVTFELCHITQPNEEEEEEAKEEEAKEAKEEEAKEEEEEDELERLYKDAAKW